MLLPLLKNIDKDNYNITVIDHVSQAMSELTLDDAIDKLNCKLNKFDSVVMSQTTHDTLTSNKRYKPAKSTVVVTNTSQGKAVTRNINYADYSTLSCKFATPEISTDLFLDKIELTIPLNKIEAKKLQKVLFKDTSNHSRIKYRKHNNPMGVKYHSSFAIETNKLGSLMLFLTPASSQIRELKVSFNPSKYKKQDLITLVKKLKKITGKKYEQRILNTNITRLDVTFDSDGYLVKDVMFNLDKSSYFKMFIRSNGVIETKITGANKSRRLQAYDKTIEEQLNESLSIGPNKVCTRIEMTIRPYNIKELKGLKLKDLDEIKPLYTNLNIYDYSKLKQLLGGNTIDWNIAHYFGIAALRRTKNNTERTKLSLLLNKCKLAFDEDAFNMLIQNKLKKIHQEFLSY